MKCKMCKLRDKWNTLKWGLAGANNYDEYVIVPVDCWNCKYFPGAMIESGSCGADHFVPKENKIP